MNSSLAMDSGIGGDYAMYLGLQKAAVACYQKGVAANAFLNKLEGGPWPREVCLETGS